VRSPVAAATVPLPASATPEGGCDAGCSALQQQLVDAATDPRGASRLAGADRINALDQGPLDPPVDRCEDAFAGSTLCHASNAAGSWLAAHKLEVATDVGMVAVQAIPVVDVAADAVEATRVAEAVGDGTSFAEAQGLRRSLASEVQMSEPGKPFAGAGTDVRLRDAGRLAARYGGAPSQWSKMKSEPFRADPFRSFETHWYQNPAGERFEPKVKLVGQSSWFWGS
jgi:hypothetical protein